MKVTQRSIQNIKFLPIFFIGYLWLVIGNWLPLGQTHQNIKHNIGHAVGERILRHHALRDLIQASQAPSFLEEILQRGCIKR